MTTIYPDVFVPLHGAHQGDNASVALAAVEAFFAAPIEDELVNEGFANVEMPGRFEVLGVQPLAIIDGAHNPPGADVCASVFFDDFHPEGRRILVMGTLRSPGEMLAALRADEFDVVHVCTAPSPRGVPATEVAKAARELGCDEVYVHDTVDAACAAAMRYADADDAILAAGSIYVAGAARPALRRLAN
jgi:dihydrofolate synthase/folylpolyglutamate synthase